MFSTFIDTYPRSPPLETCAQFPLDAHSVDAQGELMDRFLLSQSEDQLRECYLHLLKLLPQWTSLDLLVNNLPNLLDRSASFKEEQEQLALALGQRYLKAGELKKAMLCFAKALQINRSQENYLAAFKVFVHYFQLHQERRLNNFLINSTPTPDKIAFHIETIGALKQLGLPKECLTPFFNKLRDTIHQIPNEKQHAYRAHVQTIFDLRNSSWDTQQTPIERYWQALQKFRACFVKKDAHEVQEEAFNAMKQLIALCIGDICTLIGSPPCDYDLRAMGSLGRKEMCPYSDLEFIVLIEDEEHRPYFTRMVQLLELQIASFGETQGLDFVFTCLPNRSGLHLDSSPLQDERLMQNPEHMAQIQRQTDCYTKCMVLKTTSLYQTTSLLYIDYQAQLQAIRKDFPFAFFDICKQRVNEFSFTWKNHFDRAIFAYNIKTNFVETLYHPLSDLALYFGIESTNTLEIADALIDHKVLPEKMRDLLKESISLIYQIRVFNHQEHHTQEEKAYLSSTQIATLEKCYWKILIPLHTCLKKLVAPTEPHRQFFEELCSKIKDPQELAKGLKGSTSILDAILHLPSSCTVRPIYTMKIDALQASIIAITSLPPPSVPGETSVKIKTPHFTRSLWPSLARKIMEGLVLKKEYESAHRVCRLQYGVHDLHFKQTPSNPLMEYAIHSLVSRIAGEYTPPTTLVRFDVEQQGQTKSYPVLISQTIPGENLKTAWPKAIPNRSYTWNLLLAILTKPRDGHL
ncbi:MAG: DUF294 nucleotidyltransferase-like domain-containing protein, partial [Parachlamydiaceae bacterium]